MSLQRQAIKAKNAEVRYSKACVSNVLAVLRVLGVTKTTFAASGSQAVKEARHTTALRQLAIGCAYDMGARVAHLQVSFNRASAAVTQAVQEHRARKTNSFYRDMATAIVIEAQALGLPERSEEQSAETEDDAEGAEQLEEEDQGDEEEKAAIAAAA